MAWVRLTPSRLRSFVFGVEDSLVSTVGLLSGLAFVGTASETIILTGLILIFVEGFSMGVGSFLSEYSSESFKQQSEVPTGVASVNGFIMFIAYVFAGFIPLFPYVVTEVKMALLYSILASLLTLFILGVFSSKLSQTSITKGGLRMMVIGGVAVFLGVMVGYFVA